MDLVDFISPARWFRMLLLGGLGLLAIYVEAAPLGIGPTALPSPDLLLCVVAYWALRRPGSSPMLLIFALGLMRDLLTDVPVGAGALTLVLIAEVLKSQRRFVARASFPMEWVVVALAALISVFVHWSLVFLTLAQPPYLISLGYQIIYTAMVYPLIVLTFRWLFRISWKKAEVAA